MRPALPPFPCYSAYGVTDPNPNRPSISLALLFLTGFRRQILQKSFEYGLRLPIQPFFVHILSGLGVAPTQLSSMAWWNLVGLYILWKEVLGVQPIIEDVHAIFALTTVPKKSRLYYLRMYIGQPHLVPQVNPNIVDKAWDDFWFVVSGKWTRDLSRDTNIKSVREYVVTNPSKIDIVTEERLAKAGLIPPSFSGALGGEVPTLSSVTRRMAKGSKTDLTFLQLVRDRMAKAAGTPSQQAAMGSEGSGKSVLAVDLGGILGGPFAHASRALPALKQVLGFSDSKKGSEVAGLSPNQAIDMASHIFLQGSFLMSQFGDKLKEGSTSAGRVAKLEAQLSWLIQKVKDKHDQISKLEDQLGEVRDEVESVKTQLQAQVDRANEL
ncbi:hypothetical protein OWV82_010535 [Melia azedarach]|uniref:Uncharacterized protein n=1 Tax=Melia azedarach TaxID=155640 RepID=A0ACC1Y7F6_MELAZ|nr:hypothetical protein OWV82_010535 [Melia azedarach]